VKEKYLIKIFAIRIFGGESCEVLRVGVDSGVGVFMVDQSMVGRCRAMIGG